MRKAERTTAKKAPERWPVWCEDIDGKSRRQRGRGQVRQGWQSNESVLIKARK